MTRMGAVGDAARLGDRDEKLEVDQIETHGDCPAPCLRPWPKAVSVISRLCR